MCNKLKKYMLNINIIFYFLKLKFSSLSFCFEWPNKEKKQKLQIKKFKLLKKKNYNLIETTDDNDYCNNNNKTNKNYIKKNITTLNIPLNHIIRLKKVSKKV